MFEFTKDKLMAAIYCTLVCTLVGWVMYNAGNIYGYREGYLEGCGDTAVRNCDGSFGYKVGKRQETVDSILRLKLCK